MALFEQIVETLLAEKTLLRSLATGRKMTNVKSFKEEHPIGEEAMLGKVGQGTMRRTDLRVIEGSSSVLPGGICARNRAAIWLI